MWKLKNKTNIQNKTEIEMRKKGIENFNENSMWSNLYKVANEINNEKLNAYIKIGEEEIKRLSRG